MSNAGPLQVKVQDGLMILTLNNPPVNALSTAALEALDRACDQVEEDSSIRAVVITGTGPAFSAGADLKEVGGAMSADQAQGKSAQGIRVFSRIESLPAPVIAAINGLCLGGGMELAMACHLRLCSDRARLGQPEINLGLMPGWGGTQRLPRLAGKGRALRMLLTGDMISAQQALDAGVVDEVVPEGELLRQASGLAQRIASKSRVGVKQILRVVREGLEQPLAQALERETQAFAEVCQSEDAREGVAAFLEKRQPKFQDK
jgi:enoyl-CoA hydratase/carnithine racemase